MDTMKLIGMLTAGFDYELKNSEVEMEMEISMAAITGDEETPGKMKFTYKFKGDLTTKLEFGK